MTDVRFEEYDLEVCVDCVQLLANGGCDGCESCVFADDPALEPCQTVADRMVAIWGEDTRHMCLACPEECEGWFSMSPCGGCGATDHGDRHPAVVLIPLTV